MNIFLIFEEKLLPLKIKVDKIREARLKSGLSQEFVADCLKMSQANYNRLENEKIDFDLSNLSKVLDIFKLNPLEVTEFEPNQQVFVNSFINSPQSGYIVNSTITTSFSKDEFRQIIHEEIRKVIKEE